MKIRIRKTISYLLLAAVAPIIVLLGCIIFRDKLYSWIAMSMALLSCAVFFFSFEKGQRSSKEMVIIAVMIAVAVAGRMAFAALPSFKPVSAIIIVTAMYFGAEAGFLTGSLAALVSNFYFGQGPWTPFQMFAWGLVGLIAGIASKRLKDSRIALVLYGALSAVVYSLIMDVWTVLSIDSVFNLSRYITALVSASAITLSYAVSNVIFLLIIRKPAESIFGRIKTKYGF